MNDFRDDAIVSAKHCWKLPETSHIEMDPALAEAVANQIQNWMVTAAEYARNQEYYRGLVVKCGESIGEAAYICDDGGRSQDVLCTKVPELVTELVQRESRLARAVHRFCKAEEDLSLHCNDEDTSEFFDICDVHGDALEELLAIYRDMKYNA